MEEVDVLVVGAGPVGLLMAAELRRHGVERVLLVDQADERSHIAKASALQPRTLEILHAVSQHLPSAVSIDSERRGAAVGMGVPVGRAAEAAAVGSDDSFDHSNNATVDSVNPRLIDAISARALMAERLTLARVGEGGSSSKQLVSAVLRGQYDSKFDYVLLVEQWYTETCLEAHLVHHWSTHIQRGTKVHKIEESSDGVVVTLTSKHSGGDATPKSSPAVAGEQRQVRAKYVVGCDGAHSTIRHQLGIQFDGHALQQHFVLAHCQLDNVPVSATALTVLTGEGMTFITPMPDHTWLVIMDLSPQQQMMWHGGNYVAPDADDINRLMQRRGLAGARVSGPILWSSYFHVHSRQAASYSSARTGPTLANGHGRVFLAGDACHIHTPLGGQGMNTGLQDAFNLAWKLGAVVRGAAAPTLLETYEQERRPVGRSVVQVTDMLQRVTSLRHPVLSFLRDNIASFGGTLGVVTHLVAQQLGETAYSYRGRSLAWEYWQRPPVWPLSNLLVRRQQNITRLLRRRVHAGDRAPDCFVWGRRLHWLLRRGQGDSGCFWLLLFEGRNPPLDSRHVEATARSMVQAGGNLVGGCTVVRAGDMKAHSTWGVFGECAFLIRPDGYVACRTEPPSPDAIKRYLDTKIRGIRPPATCTELVARDTGDWVLTALVAAVGLGALVTTAHLLSSGGRSRGEQSVFFRVLSRLCPAMR